MKTFDEWHKEHPTPWRISRTLDGAVRFVADANGNPVTMETVVAMMNAAASRDGYTPECVAACIKAVEAYHEATMSRCQTIDELRCREQMSHDCMKLAVSLLPSKETS